MLGDETHKWVQTSDSYLDGIKVSRSLNSQANVLQSKSNKIWQERMKGGRNDQKKNALDHFQQPSVLLQTRINCRI